MSEYAIDRDKGLFVKPLNESLSPLAFRPLPCGAITPAGWLKAQLRLQADGLSGHLDEFWPDVRDSAWVGGSGDGWERGPYWLDGIIPLAALLDDATLTAKASRWIDHILTHQHADGWLGPLNPNPDPASRTGPYEVWPRFVVLKAMAQWCEATADVRIVPAMLKFFEKLAALLDDAPLTEWARARAGDLLWSIHWLIDRLESPQPDLLKLAAMVAHQGLDWCALADQFRYTAKVEHAALLAYQASAGGVWLNDDFGFTHGVNVAMGLKTPGLLYRQSGNERHRHAASRLLNLLDQFHGQPNRMYSCDEHLAGRHPSQGAELCSIVELMFSLESLISTTGDAAFADRLEQIAFNPLAGAFSPDMWLHQYDQQANQIACKVCADPSGGRIYSTNGPDANLFGLEPNFGCCTANFHQGWPKFAAHLWMRSADGALTAISYAPCTVRTYDPVPVVIDVQTQYPFEDDVRIIVRTETPAEFAIDLRIPEWAQDACYNINGGAWQSAGSAPFHRVKRLWADADTLTLRLPAKFEIERRSECTGSLTRGPLVYAVAIDGEWRKLRGEPPAVDYEVHPIEPWNLAVKLQIDQLHLQRSSIDHAPFSPAEHRQNVRATAVVVKEWKIEKNAAADPAMLDPVVQGTQSQVEVSLLPYGATHLRLTEVPLIQSPY